MYKAYTYPDNICIATLYRCGKQKLKLSSTEFSHQLSDKYPQEKLSFPLSIPQSGLKTDVDHKSWEGSWQVICVYMESDDSHL